MHACANCLPKPSGTKATGISSLVFPITNPWLFPFPCGSVRFQIDFTYEPLLTFISIDVNNNRPLPGIFLFSRKLVLVTARGQALLSVSDLSLTVREALHLTHSRVSTGREMKLKHPGDRFYLGDKCVFNSINRDTMHHLSPSHSVTSTW